MHINIVPLPLVTNMPYYCSAYKGYSWVPYQFPSYAFSNRTKGNIELI